MDYNKKIEDFKKAKEEFVKAVEEHLRVFSPLSDEDEEIKLQEIKEFLENK
jgi:hypothetical protein